jgi:hypothetical protein
MDFFFSVSCSAGAHIPESREVLFLRKQLAFYQERQV